MKTVLFAPDSFKESLSAKEVCEAMEKGFKQAKPNYNYLQVPMADGGEGTLQSLIDATHGELFTTRVKGPLGVEIEAEYGILGDGKTGVIEMAAASGIQLLSTAERNPLHTSTYGTGQLIKACLDKGVKSIIIGIGGSATNDGGSGMAAALGVQFLDESGQALAPGGGHLGALAEIDLSAFDQRMADVKMIVACDVDNPLCGDTGASAVFGPQKGASPAMVADLDQNLAHYAEIIEKQIGLKVKDVPGAGAAGGLGAGLLAFTRAELQKGIDIVVNYTDLESKILEADYIITGEGGMDFQTKFGKTPFGVAQLAQKHNVPVIGIAGYLGEGIEELYDEGFQAIFGILPGAVSLKSALATGAENVTRTCRNIASLL